MYGGPCPEGITATGVSRTLPGRAGPVQTPITDRKCENGLLVGVLVCGDKGTLSPYTMIGV